MKGRIAREERKKRGQRRNKKTFEAEIEKERGERRNERKHYICQYQRGCGFLVKL